MMRTKSPTSFLLLLVGACASLVICFGCSEKVASQDVSQRDVGTPPTEDGQTVEKPSNSPISPTENATESTDDKPAPTTEEESKPEPSSDYLLGKYEVPLGGGYRPSASTPSPLMTDLIDNARAAMSRRDMVTTSQLLRLSRPEDPSMADARELERVWLMSRLLVKFWSGVRATQNSLKVGDELWFADEQVTVTSIEVDQIMLKGTTAEYSLPSAAENMSSKLAEALARQGLKSSGVAATKMIVAFHLLDKLGSRERAKQLCTQLEKTGISVDLFLPEL